MSSFPQHSAPPFEPAPTPDAAPALWDSVSVSWRGRRLLRGFSHVARAGGIIGVIGAGGRDLDITLLTLAARRPPTSGTVTIAGAPDSVAVARLSSMPIDDPLTTVGESLRTVTPRAPQANSAEIMRWAAITAGSLDLVDRPWADLTPGQRVRAGLACALSSGAAVIAANAADVSTPAEMADVWSAITTMASSGRILLIGWPTPTAHMSATATLLAAAPEGLR